MFGKNRDQLRRVYLDCWQKQQQGELLAGIELIVAQVIQQHPEYHAILKEDNLDKDFHIADGETNPFLHMGMHITLAEQLGSDRPTGIRALHQSITQKAGDAHEAEHQMMECLGLVLWEAQRANQTPDEQAYLECLRKLAGTL
jgi:hypothetical protein